MGGTTEVDKFYRLFLALGIGHCALGRGPIPTDPLAALVDWVEKGEAPEAINAATVNEAGETITQQLCKWPAKKASSWTCPSSRKMSGTVNDSNARGGEHDEL